MVEQDQRLLTISELAKISAMNMRQNHPQKLLACLVETFEAVEAVSCSSTILRTNG